MPKIVDHDQRKREITTALWRVIRRGGVEGATVRAVAHESGWSAGTLRHYFTTQDELLSFAMTAVVERVSTRLAALPPDAPVTDVLWELLPLDDERRAESEVWLAFQPRAMTDPGLRAIRDDAYARYFALCERLSARLCPDADAGRLNGIAREVNALLDGVVVHAVTRPDFWPPEEVRRIVRQHLDRLPRD